MRQLPKHIKIMSDKVSIKLCRTKKEVDPGGKSLGKCDTDNSEIRIYARLPLGKLKKTLLHEALHYCLDETGSDVLIKEKAEEALVCNLECALFSFLTDNEIDWRTQ